MLDMKLFGKTRAAILRELYLNPDRRISFNELVRRTGSGDGAVSRELRNLLAIGLIDEVREGNQRFLRAAKQSQVFTEMKAFVMRVSGAPRILREALRDLEREIDLAFIFGSVATGREHADSDLDLLVIGAAGYSVVSERLRAVEKRLGRRVQTLYFNSKSAVDRDSLRKPSMQTLLSGPKRYVIGGDENLSPYMKANRRPGGQSQKSRQPDSRTPARAAPVRTGLARATRTRDASRNFDR